MQLYFYALEEDIENILEYMLTQEDFRFFEGYSETDQSIREFKSTTDWRIARKISKRCLLLRGWSENFTSGTAFSEIVHKPHVGGRRTELKGVAIVQIQEAYKLDNGALFPARISHWNEAGAKQNSWTDAQINEVDWLELKRTSGRIQRYIRKLGEAKVNSMPVLPAAFAGLRAKTFSLWNFGEPISLGSERLVVS